MLSSVLRSGRAARVNIEVVRAFVRLRRALAVSRGLEERLEKAEKELAEHGAALGEHADALRAVFEEVRALAGPGGGPKRRIGFASGD